MTTSLKNVAMFKCHAYGGLVFKIDVPVVVSEGLDSVAYDHVNMVTRNAAVYPVTRHRSTLYGCTPEGVFDEDSDALCSMDTGCIRDVFAAIGYEARA